MAPSADTVDLLAHSRDADAAAFSRLVARHIDFVYGVARRETGESHLAEDVTQAVFIVLARKSGSVAPARLPAWLFTTTRHLSANARRAAARRAYHERHAAQSKREDSMPTDPAENQHVREHLNRAIASLSSADQSVVLLRFVEGFSVAQVAEAVGVNESAARKRLDRAVERLRQFFSRQGVVLGVAGVGPAVQSALEPAPSHLVASLQGGAMASPGVMVLAKSIGFNTFSKAAVIAAGTVVGALVVVGIVTQAPPVPANTGNSPASTSATAPAGAPIPAQPALSLADLTPEERKACELIYRFRLAVPPEDPDEWIGALKEVTELGKPAVPMLIAELKTAKRDSEIRLLLMSLRIIGDPRAVPAIIEKVPTVVDRASDYGLVVHDPDLREFLDSHHWDGKRPTDNDSSFNRSITECVGALEAITDHSEGHEPIMGRMPAREPFVKRWTAWWEENRATLVTPEQMQDLAAADAKVALIEVAGVARFGPLFPTGPDVKLGPVREMIVQTQGAYDARAYLDFDSDYAYFHDEFLEFTGKSESWMEDAGVDLYTHTSIYDNNDAHLVCTVDGNNLHSWPIAPERFETIEPEVKQDRPLDRGIWGPSGNLSARNLKTGGYRGYSTEPYAFLFKTQSGTRGILKVIESLKDGAEVRIVYRKWESADVIPSRLSTLRKNAPPSTAPARAYGPAQEVELNQNQSMDIDTGTRHTFDLPDELDKWGDAYRLAFSAGDDIVPARFVTRDRAKQFYMGGLHASAKTKTLELSDQAWETLSADQAWQLVERAKSQKRDSPHGLYAITTGKNGGGIVITEQGTIAVVQMTELGETSVKLRYKLLK